MIKADLIPGFVQEFFDAITSRISGAFSWVFDYIFLGEWYVLGFAILAGALLLSWFFGALPVIGGWIRGLSGVVVLLYAAFLAGMTIMFNYMRRRQSERE